MKFNGVTETNDITFVFSIIAAAVPADPCYLSSIRDIIRHIAA